MADKLKAFTAWLIECGAIIDPPTNPYEILRVRTCEGVFVAYTNAKGRENWPAGLEKLRDDFKANRGRALSPDLTSRVRLRHRIETIAARDGLECWFCGAGFLSTDSDDITIEHLVAKSHGGPDHLSNLVIADEKCNRAADRMSVSEKVLMRERMRAKESEPAND